MKLPAGKLDFSISRMIHEELSVPLGTALQTAITESREVAYSEVPVPGNESGAALQLRVRPVGRGDGEYLYAVIFERDCAETARGGQATPFRLDDAVKRRITDLENELQYTRQNLQATIEELETSNEELQATNEELVSSNEELQSTNEELQSVNEELVTVNSEYQKKIEELSELNADMNNLLSSTDIGTVFLDQSLRVRKFTPPVTKQINLIKSDVGRPLSDISHNLLYDDLEQDIGEVLRTLKPLEVEVESRLDKWFLLKIQPYRTSEESVRGVVVTFVDITQRKMTEHELQQQQELMMRVLESNPTAITMVDRHGSIIFANRRAEELLGMSRTELTDMSYDDSGFRITDENGAPIPTEELPFSRIRETRKPVSRFTHRVQRPDGTTVDLAITGNPIYDHDGSVDGAVFNLREVSQDEEACD
jgi:two-component system CheB/CheR fusion protein